jgi:ferredoxin--NADP+ reductase
VTLRVAVVGSGPAGFYAAGHLLDSDLPVEVDMIERLPTPWGLVRLGVAPDHPKIKAVSKAFERIAARPGFRLLGGVEVGRDLAHDDLVRLYDAVVYAVGAQTDRRMGIPGEDLPGSWAATELVAWYNGHPDYQELEFDLSGKRAVVVGAGNVALDVVRMLALSPEEIRPTDTTDEAIEAILGSGIEEIVLLARRGPAQAAFTTSTRRSSSSTLRARPRSSATRRRAETSRSCASTARGHRPASSARSGCASASRRSRSSARSGSRASRSSATGWSPTSRGA